jgi:threonine aldolase
MMARFRAACANGLPARGMAWDHIKPAIGAKIYHRARSGLGRTPNMAAARDALPVFEGIWVGARGAAGASMAHDFNAATALGLRLIDEWLIR